MAVLKPQPRTRQRALLKEWGIDEQYVPEDGIGDEGVTVVMEASPNDWEISVVRCQLGELVRTTLAYPTRDHHERMLKAQQDDWEEYIRSYGPRLEWTEIEQAEES